jgi:hypothetical protein
VAWDISGVSGSPTNGSFIWKRNIISGRTISYSSSVNGTTLTSNSSYRAQVRFTYESCLRPTNLSASNITINSADVSWNAPTGGATGYEYAVTASPTPPASGTPTTTTNGQASGLLLNTTYYLHVRSQCSPVDYSTWETTTFQTLDAYCKPPTSVFYSNITTNSIDILWSQMPTSDHYEYLYDVTPNVVPTSANSISTSAFNVSLNSLKPDTKYYLFVRSICLGGSDSSTWMLDSFVTKAECKPPVLTVSNFNTLNPSATWLKNPIAIEYEYRVTGSEIQPAYGDGIVDTFVNLALPDDNSDQYLHVRCKCYSQFTFSDWATEPLRLTPNTISILDNANIQVYPNPITDKIYIRGAAGSRAVLIDIKGIALGDYQIKDDVFTIDASALPAGYYILKCISNDGFINYKVQKR